MGICYWNGTGAVQNRELGADWIIKAASKDHIKSQEAIGRYHFKQQEYSEAVEWLEKIGDVGDSDTQLILGVCFLNGWGVEKDYSMAVSWFEKAARRDNPSALFNLALCYRFDSGVPQNLETSFSLYWKAASLNLPNGQYAIGAMLEVGEGGCVQNLPEAVKYYQLAAEAGHAMAQERLVVCFELGLGINRDISKSIYWYRKAALDSSTSATTALRRIYKLGITL